MASLSLGVFRALLFLFPPAAEPIPLSDLSRLQTAKNVGLAALEEGDLEEALRNFETVRKIAPSEPMGWANGAVAAMRSKDLESAGRLLEEAIRRSPEDPRILALEGTRRELAGDREGAMEAFEKAAAADPKDLASRWSAARLAAELGAGTRRRAVPLVSSALEQAPSNQFLLLRLYELAAASGDRAAASAARDRLEASIESPDARLAKFLQETRAALEAGDLAAAGLKARIVENLLRGSPRYQQARHEVEPGVVGLPLEDWSPALAAKWSARPSPIPVAFSLIGKSGLSAVRSAGSVRPFGRHARDLAFAGPGGVFVAAAGARYRPAEPVARSAAASLEAADVDNSGELDLITPGSLWLAGREGFRRVPIPAADRVLPIDHDSDGDLDLYLSARGGDRLLRNNLDGSWTDVTAASLPAGSASRGAVAADFDRDGDPDLALITVRGGVLLLDNRRGGRLASRAAGLPEAGPFLRPGAADVNADGRPDLVASGETSSSVWINRGDGTFHESRSLAWGGNPLFFDFDNDGFPDLFLASSRGSALFRNQGSGSFSLQGGVLQAALDAAAVDFDGDGDLDLALVTPSGGGAILQNDGGNANGWLDVSLEGLPTGSAKVNRLGYGSEVELKAGDLYVYERVTRPVTHAGLGKRRRADVLRIVWSNGVPQNALSPPARTLLREIQQLKGSCPFVYVFDGTRWHFLTDALGRSPVGLLFDGIHQAAADTREWLVVPGDRLAAVEGKLRLDFTEELWETVYFDYAELRAIDHPRGIEVVSNEKMVPPPFPPKALFTVARPLTPRATDGEGRDRTEEIARADSRYLGGFTPTRYQGIVAAHELVLDLPEARSASSVRLYLTGWIFYGDTSLNVSLSQGSAEKPFGPLLEVPDGRGGWKTAVPAMGYPAGKTKTMPVDLSAILDRRDPRVRIRTNLEIYWDRIAYTADDPSSPLWVSAAPLASARLSARGFSRMVRESPDGPHVFLHDEVETAPRWADMAGLYTRLGDVRELLTQVDDRFVVMKAGDAVRLEFEARALPPLQAGWTRDWLLVLDGWDKDADKNTVAGQTVEPLPFHGQDPARYGVDQPFPDGPEHRRFQRETLTRRGGPEEFLDAVRRGVARQAREPPR